MNNFKNMLKESESDLMRKFKGKLSKADTALRMSNNAIGAIIHNIDEFKKGRMNAEEFSEIVSDYRKDLKDASISIAKAGKK